MKTKFAKFALVTMALLAIVFTTTAAGLLSPSKVVDSSLNWTNAVRAAVGYTNIVRIDCREGKNLALEIVTGAHDGSAGTNAVFIGRNNSGSTTVADIDVFTNAVSVNTGTAKTRTMLDVPINGYAYAYICSVTNYTASGGALTNYYVIANVK